MDTIQMQVVLVVEVVEEEVVDAVADEMVEEVVVHNSKDTTTKASIATLMAHAIITVGSARIQEKIINGMPPLKTKWVVRQKTATDSWGAVVIV